MDDLSQKLSELLNDPESMNRVKQMAENLLGGQANEPEVINADDSGFSDISDLTALMPLISRFKNTGDDSRVRLIDALKPHLSDDKREKADTAIKILKALELLPYLKESGLLKL